VAEVASRTAEAPASPQMQAGIRGSRIQITKRTQRVENVSSDRETNPSQIPPMELVGLGSKRVRSPRAGRIIVSEQQLSYQRHRSTPFHHTSRSHSSRHVLAHCRLVHQRAPNCTSSRAAATEKDFP
jgi:hypothetical protein